MKNDEAQSEPRLASQARHKVVAQQEAFASRIVVLGCYEVLNERP